MSQNPRRSARRPRASLRIPSRMWLSSSTTKMTGASEVSTVSNRRPTGGCNAGCGIESRRWIACMTSAALTGLLSCTQSWLAMSPQGIRRDVAGQNDDRYLAMKLFLSIFVDT